MYRLALLVPEPLILQEPHFGEGIAVYYEGQVVGDYYADLCVEDRVIVELKAGVALHKAHEVQLVNYLTATGIDIGLLLNFGESVEVKRKYREYKPKKAKQD